MGCILYRKQFSLPDEILGQIVSYFIELLGHFSILGLIVMVQSRFCNNLRQTDLQSYQSSHIQVALL